MKTGMEIIGGFLLQPHHFLLNQSPFWRKFAIVGVAGKNASPGAQNNGKDTVLLPKCLLWTLLIKSDPTFHLFLNWDRTPLVFYKAWI